MQRLLSVTAIVIATTMATAGFTKDFPEIPDNHIKYLMDNPDSADFFDKNYGAGIDCPVVHMVG